MSVFGLKAIGISQELAESLQEHLESNLLQYRRFEVLSRSDIALILKENQFQQSGTCTGDECVVEAGHILGVQKIVTGTLSKIGNTCNVVLKLIDVQSGKLESSANRQYTGGVEGLLEVMEQLLDDVVDEATVRGFLPERDTVVVRDTVWKENRIVRTETDTVRVRDTVWVQKHPEPAVPVVSQAPAPARKPVPAVPTRPSRKARRVTLGATIILCCLAAVVITASITD
jgi:TolB-like protein